MKISQWRNSQEENQSILELTENTFPDSDIKNPKYFHWQYNENPQGKAIIVLCFDEEKDDFVIGQKTIIPTELSLGNTYVKSSNGVNSIVHSNYRRKGIFSKLLRALPDLALKEGITCTYGVPNPRSHPVFLKEGWKEITHLPLLVRILNPSNFFKNGLKILLRPISFFYKIKNIDQAGIEKYSGNFNEFEQLTSKLATRIQVSQNRNRRYLQWRYNEHPTRKYNTYIIRKKSEIISYIITRETESKGKSIGVVLDFVTDGKHENEKEFLNLVSYSLKELQNKNVALSIATFSPSLLEYKILCKAGFFKVPDILKRKHSPLLVNIFDKNNQELKCIENYDNWFFTFGDYDAY